MAVKTISTVSALKSYLLEMESQRVETFTFLPKGALAQRCPKGNVVDLLLDLTSLICRASTQTTTVNGEVTQVTCTVTYHDSVRMLDAWRMRRTSSLTREEQYAVQTAEQIVTNICGRRKLPIERLYMLYSYIGATIDYRAGNEHSAEFSQLTSAAWTMVRKVGNCQGFANVMYLCGGMMGFRMGLQSGRSTAGGHMWNTIELGTSRYAMDCSASAVARSQSRRMLADYASFLMGKRETAENGLTWTAEQETVKLTARLAPEHDYYHAAGLSFTTATAAAREVWKRRLAGEKLTHVRIRGQAPVSLNELIRAIRAVGEEPAMNRAIFSKLSGSISYGVIGTDGPATYASVEWGG